MGSDMKRIFILAVLALFAAPAFAKMSCDELVAKIDQKLEKKGVKHYTLTVIPADEATDLRVVGTCDGNKKKIVYKRGASKE